MMPAVADMTLRSACPSRQAICSYAPLAQGCAIASRIESVPPSVDRDVVQWYIHAAAHAFAWEVNPGIAIQVTGEGLFDQA
jgi:hypothetical protein